jgi:signal transduction histidine kinase
MFLLIALVIAVSLFLWIFRCYVVSLYEYLLVRFERKKIDFQLLSSLRDDLVHERKKKMAGLEMMLSSWERGDEIQPKYEYFEELVDQLKNLVREGRKNLMAVTKDIWLWGKLWSMLRRIEKVSKQKTERVEIVELRKALVRFQNLMDEVVEGSTKKFSFTLNEVVSESVKIVRIEKSQLKNIEIQEQLDDVGDTIRFSYDKFKDWQRLLTNLIRNAIEAVEAKQSSGAGVASDFSLRGGDQTVVADLGLPGGREISWVKISTKPSVSVPVSVSVCIEDSGIGMDETTKSSFYKKGFTFGKEGGLGLGVNEESVELIHRYGGWQVESELGKGTKITIEVKKEKAEKERIEIEGKRTISQRVFPTPTRAVLVGLFLVIMGLGILFTVDKYSRFWVDWNPVSVKLRDEHTVVVQGKDGRFLWDRKFHQTINDRGLAVEDIDKDGKNEVLVGTRSGFKKPGCVYCFSFDEKELWQFELGEKGVYSTQSVLFDADMILVKDLDLDGVMEIMVGVYNYPYFAYQIAVFNKEGQMKNSYWHSGTIRILLCEDIDGDSIPEIVFGGLNNKLQYSAVIGVLDYKTIHGQSPPYKDKVLPKAQEKVYIKFPFVKGWGGENELYSSANVFMNMGKENGVDVYRADIHDHQGFVREYYLDESLAYVRSIVIHPDSRFIWQNLRKEGILDYDITPEVIESWKKIEVWKNGVKVK